MNEEIVKIRTKKGRIITLSVSKKNECYYYGTDKFGHDVIISVNDIDNLTTIRPRGDFHG